MFLFKKLKPLGKDVEQDFLNEILNSKSVWFTAINHGNGRLEFVMNKPDCQFYMSRLTKFPNLCKKILELYPEANLVNSYVTKCFPGYHMVPHVDANRKTAIILPLGENRGKLSYFVFNKKIVTHKYTGPLLSRVDMFHSAENDSDNIRYSITLEVPGTYFQNFFKYSGTLL